MPSRHYSLMTLITSRLSVRSPWALQSALLYSSCSSSTPDTLEGDEKKDESPRLSFFLPAVDLKAYFFPRTGCP